MPIHSLHSMSYDAHNEWVSNTPMPISILIFIPYHSTYSSISTYVSILFVVALWHLSLLLFIFISSLFSISLFPDPSSMNSARLVINLIIFIYFLVIFLYTLICLIFVLVISIWFHHIIIFYSSALILVFVPPALIFDSCIIIFFVFSIAGILRAVVILLVS